MDGTNFTRRVFFLCNVLRLEAKFSGRTILDNEDVFQLSLSLKLPLNMKEGICHNLIGV